MLNLYPNIESLVSMMLFFFIRISMLYLFHYRVFGYKYKSYLPIIGAIVVYLPIQIIIRGLLFNPIYNTPIFILFSPMVLDAIFLRERKLLNGVISLVYTYLFDALVSDTVYILMLYGVKNLPSIPKKILYINIAGQLAIGVVYLVVMLIASKYVKDIIYADYPKPLFLSILLLPAFSYFINTLVNKIQPKIAPPNNVLLDNIVFKYYFLFYFTVLILNLVSVFLFSRTTVFMTGKLERQQLSQQVLGLTDALDDKIKQQQSERQLVHDLSNILIASKGEVSATTLGKYIKEIEDKEPKFFTGVAEIDSILTTKEKLAEMAEITLNIEVIQEGRGSINFVDFGTALGIALDNAIEAGEGVADYSVTVAISLSENLATFGVSNFIATPIIKDSDGNFLSTKKGGNRGYGIKGLEFLTKEDGRELIINQQSNEFQVRVMFWENA